MLEAMLEFDEGVVIKLGKTVQNPTAPQYQSFTTLHATSM
jgi:hypothetical protein